MFLFLYTYQPNPILLDFGIITIHWYGLILAVAVTSGFFVFLNLSRASSRKMFGRQVMKPAPNIFRPGAKRSYGTILDNFFINLFFYTTIFSILGGRLFHVLTFLNYYLKNPLEIFAIWQGGISFYGVFLFGLLSLFFFSGKSYQEKYRNIEIKKYSNNQKENRFFITLLLYYFITFLKKRWLAFLLIMDLVAPALALAQSIGRWGNWFNQELFGLPCNWAWCIPIDAAHRPLEYLSFTHFHPVFLYESVLMLLVFIFLFKMHKYNYCSPLVSSPRDPAGLPLEPLVRTPAGSSGQIVPGSIFIFYLIFHSLIRFTLEFLRLDVQPILLGLRLFQWFALVEFLAGIVLVFILKKWYNKSTETLEHLNT